MQSLLDWTFVIGAGAAFLIVPLAVFAVWLGRAPRWFAALTTVLGIVVWLLFIGHWVVWWFAFDHVRGEPVPNDLFPVTTVLMAASTIGCLLLLAASATAWATRLLGRSATVH
jgi:hypothetical protein